MQYILGETNKEIQIETLTENRCMALLLAQQARYGIDIFTQDLDAEIFNNTEFEQSIIKLAKKHPNTRIRILAQETGKAIQNGHCLIRLAQHLTSSVFIHRPDETHVNKQDNYIIVDKIGFLRRTRAVSNNYNAVINFKAARTAEKLTDAFDDVWEQSEPDIQIRRFSI